MTHDTHEKPRQLKGVICPDCKGRGAFYDDDARHTICQVCGGRGWLNHRAKSRYDKSHKEDGDASS